MPSHKVDEYSDSAAKALRPLLPVNRIFEAFVTTIVPEATQLDLTSWNELESLVDETLNGRPAEMHRQLRLFLRVVEWLPILRYGRPFTVLDASKRTKVLTYLQNHPLELIRTGFWGLRTLAFLGYYGRQAAVSEIGYRATRSGWEALP